MSNYYISINQFAEFTSATTAGKRRILKQQKIPNKLLIPWYQRAKGAIRKFLQNVNDSSPLDEAIHGLRNKSCINSRQQTDRAVSIEALETLKKMKLPKLLKVLDYEVIFADDKKLLINNVDIIIAPEIIIKAAFKGDVVYGAVKIHISKGKPFNLNQSKYVASAVYQFLSKKVAHENERVVPELCLCLDIFAGQLTPAPDNVSSQLSSMRTVCDEIKNLWATS